MSHSMFPRYERYWDLLHLMAKLGIISKQQFFEAQLKIPAGMEPHPDWVGHP